LNGTATFGVLNAGEQRGFEQLGFVFEFFHVPSRGSPQYKAQAAARSCTTWPSDL
jgi:hypothetical protein